MELKHVHHFEAVVATLGLIATAGAAGDRAARADLIFSNFDQGTALLNYTFFNQNQPATEYEGAIRFEPPVSFFVDALELPVFNAGEDQPLYSPPLPPGTVFGDSMAVAIYADDNGTPGQLLESVDAPDSLLLWNFPEPSPPPVLVEFTGTTFLEKGQGYWIGVIETEGSVVAWQSADFMTPFQLRARIVGGPWGGPQDRRLGLRVYGTPVPQCDADITGDNEVNIDDLLAVIGAWGPCPAPPTACPANIATSGASATTVDIDDLLAVISAWGPCP